MHIKDANQLLDAFYLPFESGWQRLDTGVINIAVRTHMIGCTPAMVDWWLGFLHHSEEYRWWHPRDHVFSDWDGECEPGKYLGRTHLAHEYIGPHLSKLKIHFRDPGEILDKRRFAEAKVGTAIMAWGDR
jgi:DAPG hydrolase PhiG domain